MILARTPLRISLAGGGTDLPWYADKHGGYCITLAIDKYVHVSLSRRYTGHNLVHYRSTEAGEVGCGDWGHPIIREVLKAYPIPEPFELHTTADIDSNSGLGSSSAFTVCLLRAVWAARGEDGGPNLLTRLAEEAYRIEHDVLDAPIGRQDAYACTLGGLQDLRFPAGSGAAETMRWVGCEPLLDSLLLFDTGLRRDANACLRGQEKRAGINVDRMHRVKDDARVLARILGGEISVSTYGDMLRAHWARKKDLAPGMTHTRIDEGIGICAVYGVGTKLVGAGGGGFILACIPDEKRAGVVDAMRAAGFRHVPFKPSWTGAEILADTEDA